MIKVIDKINERDNKLIAKAMHKSTVAGYLTAIGLGLAEGAAIAALEIGAVALVFTVVTKIKGKR